MTGPTARIPALIAIAVLLAGCASADLASPLPPTAGPPTPTPTPTPSDPNSWSGSPAAELVEVAVDSLAIGDGTAGTPPGPSAVRADAPAGTRLWVLEDDGDWLFVAAFGPPLFDEGPIGWVPASADGSPTVRPVELACPPPQLSVEQLAGLGPLGGLACYGSHPLEVIGYSPTGCGAGGSPRTGHPDWLNGTWSGIGIGSEEPRPPDWEPRFAIRARVAPGSGITAGCGEPGWYRFVGHFDDPASAGCRTEISFNPPVVVAPPMSQLMCRAELVLDAAVRLAASP